MARHPHILLVEDEPAVSASLARFLEARGYLVDHATEVDAALAVLQWCAIDAVILDILLASPGREPESGLDVLITMRHQPALARLPVVILTGIPLDDAMQALIRTHDATVFCKPERYATIARHLRAVIQQTPHLRERRREVRDGRSRNRGPRELPRSRDHP